MLLDQTGKLEIDVPKLLQAMILHKYKLKNRLIYKMRNRMRASVEDDL